MPFDLRAFRGKDAEYKKNVEEAKKQHFDRLKAAAGKKPPKPATKKKSKND